MPYALTLTLMSRIFDAATQQLLGMPAIYNMP